jgi:alkylhydroperoxidase family enzyme
MANITNEHEALVRRILEGKGRAPHAQRRAAFDNSGLTGPLRTLTEKVAKHAYKVTDEDIATARSSGLSEDQIFELAVCAAVGHATRQYEAAIAALETATGGSSHASRHSR